jgi:prepilin-type N-terminal cleavage/methylation domain-containing protein/prepilin-type processing-associated H-X9-DG protein
MANTIRKAFTLVELLVVVSIIALLISILLPALNTAREVTEKTICATNLRSITAAVLQYAADHDGILMPAVIEPGAGGDFDATGDIYSNILVREEYVTAPNANNGLDEGTQGSLFRCPEGLVGENVRYLPAEGPHTTPDHFSFTYLPGEADESGATLIGEVAVPTWYMLAAGNHPNWSFRHVSRADRWDSLHNISAVRAPGRQVVVSETPSLNATPPGWRPGRMAGRHAPFVNDGRDADANFGFFDGHVDSFTTRDWYEGMEVHNPEYMWPAHGDW